MCVVNGCISHQLWIRVTLPMKSSGCPSWIFIAIVFMRFFLCSDDAIHQPSGWLWLSLVLVVGLLSVPGYPAPVINGICSYGSNQNKISARFENDHVIQAVSPDWPDDPFAIRILSRTPKGSFYFPDSHPNDLRSSPCWIGSTHGADQFLNFLTNARSARSSVPGFVCPIPFEPPFVPVDDSSGSGGF